MHFKLHEIWTRQRQVIWWNQKQSESIPVGCVLPAPVATTRCQYGSRYLVCLTSFVYLSTLDIPTPSYTYPQIPTPWVYLPPDTYTHEYTYPLEGPETRDTYSMSILNPWKGPGTSDAYRPPKGSGTRDTYPPRAQTNTCENITFLQLRWQEVISEFYSIFCTLHFCLSHAAVTFSSITKL